MPISYLLTCNPLRARLVLLVMRSGPFSRRNSGLSHERAQTTTTTTTATATATATNNNNNNTNNNNNNNNSKHIKQSAR